jgi:outer membrane protein assembly factor BamE (lipoprotein component of BamABCDE complex)
MTNYFSGVLTISVLIGLISLTGCKTASEHANDVKEAETSTSKITVGSVQRKIKIGMPSAEVVEALGSPNMVTTDSQRRENWVYDKISSERVYSEMVGGVNALILGSLQAAGVERTSQKTLTIIIKYDKNNLVRDFAYRYSSF